MGWGERCAGVIEEVGVPGMAIIVAALRLGEADPCEFGLGVNGLVGAWTEQNLWLGGKVLLEQEAEAHRRTAFKGEQAGGRASGGIKVSGTDERRRFWTVGNLPIVIGCIIVNGNADLAQIGKANGSLTLLACGGQGREQ